MRYIGYNLLNIIIYETKEIYNSPAGDMRCLHAVRLAPLVWHNPQSLGRGA